MSVTVDCVLAKEVATYSLLSKHSVLNNSINLTTVKDSILTFLDCLPVNQCSNYVYDCATTTPARCNIVIKLDATTSICKTPLIQLI